MKVGKKTSDRFSMETLVHESIGLCGKWENCHPHGGILIEIQGMIVDGYKKKMIVHDYKPWCTGIQRMVWVASWRRQVGGPKCASW